MRPSPSSPKECRPLILGIESATPWSSIALLGDEYCFWEQNILAKISHSKRLLLMIHKLMEQMSLDWKDLDGIAVSIGPGSFTGLRIGLAAAKGLALATGLPLFGVSTLDGLAFQQYHCRTLICPVLDARKKEIYAALYQWEKKDELTRLTEYMATSPEKLATMVEGPVTVVGDGALLYKSRFDEKLKGRVFFAPPALSFPRAAAIAKLAVALCRTGHALDPTSANPIYVRPSDAERNTVPGE